MRFNPFNPQQPARPDFFVGREPEINEFEKFLIQTIHGSPMNMSISGNRGMGKTSILIKFEQIAKDNNCLVVRLSNYEENINNIIDLCSFISSNIKAEVLSKNPIKNKLTKFEEWIGALKPTVGWKDFTLTLEKKQIAQEMFRKRLVDLWAEARADFKAIVLLIDEAESLENVLGALTFLREVFQRISNEANYMVVLAGKLNFPERMSESFSPLNRFFPVQKLKSFNRNEINNYIQKKLAVEEINVKIDEKCVTYITNISEGHPYVLVSMCYLVFDSLRDDESFINMQLIQRASQKIKFQLGQDFFSPMFHPLTAKAKDILFLITKNINGTEFTFKDALKWTGREAAYLSPYILELLKKGILNKPERAKYKIFHALFAEYVNGLKQ